MTESREQIETVVLGCMLLESRCIDVFAAAGGTPRWFSNPKCKTVASVVFERYEQGKIASDIITIAENINTPGIDIGFLSQCCDSTPTTAHSEYYTQILSGYAEIDKLKALVKQSALALDAASPENVKEVKAEIESYLQMSLSNAGPEKDGSMAEAAIRWIDRMTADESETTLLDWLHRDVTDVLGRVDRELIWIIAMPSIGKTAFVIQWIVVLAQRYMVSLASLESSKESIASRIVSLTAPMNTFDIRQRRATDEQIEKARIAARNISDNIRVTDKGMTIEQIYAWGRSEVRNGSKMLVIDNTRHVRYGSDMKRQDGVSLMSQRFKQLRDDTGVPVVVLHHSKVDERGKEDASWSQDIRRDADVMIFLQDNPEKTVKPSHTNKTGRSCVRVTSSKYREGGTGVPVELEFKKEIQTFERWIDVPIPAEIDADMDAFTV